MALQRFMADGTEHACHKCGRSFREGDMKVRRMSFKPNMPGTFTVGGKHFIWTHEACAPTRKKNHSYVKA